MHGPSLHNRHLSHSTPKKARTRQHRNIKGENEWLLSNVFDSQRNYKFCPSCLLAWLDVHEGSLARLRKVKQQQHMQPLQQMTKGEVDASKLQQYTVIPGTVVGHTETRGHCYHQISTWDTSAGGEKVKSPRLTSN